MSAEDTSRKWLRAVFGLDLRSLALFRMGLGGVLVCDLVERLCDAEAFYSDFGILPRTALFAEVSDPWDWSLHALSGQPEVVALLFVVQLTIAVSFLVGYRTRLVTLLCWLLIISVQHRNEFVGHGGDQLLRTLFLWSLFLPLGARWSVDSALHSLDRSRMPAWLSLGGIALVLQTCFIYWGTLLLKWHPDWWQGRAVGIALESDQFALPLALLLRELTWTNPLLTWLTLHVEVAGPLLLLLPLAWGWQRLVAVAIMVGLHTGFGLCLNVLAFSITSIVFWLVFTPSVFWNWLLHNNSPQNTAGLQLIYNGECILAQRSAQIVRGLLGLPRSVIRRSSEKAPISALIDSEHTWVVRRDDGEVFFRYGAFLALLPYSFLGRYTVWFWGLDVLRFAGDRICQFAGNHRVSLSSLLSWRHPSEPLRARIWPHRVREVLCAILIVVVFVSNVRRLDMSSGSFFKEDLVTGLQELGLVNRPQGYNPKDPPRQPNWLGWDWYDAIEGPLDAFLLHQSWSMFAPSPMIDDGWFVIIGTRVDGTVEELYNEGGFRSGESAAVTENTWEKPIPVVDTYLSARWRKYLYRQLWMVDNSPHRQLFGQYLTRVYERADKKRFGKAAWSGAKRLLFFEIYYMLERTRPEGGHRPVQKKLITTHRCY